MNVALVAAAVLSIPAAAQGPGVEAQVYPAGLIGVVRYGQAVGPTTVLDAGAGINVTDRRDWGVHLDEQGWGPGGFLGVRLAQSAGPWWVGVRSALWALRVDWRDLPTQPEGRTSVLVWQPTARVGWRWRTGAWAGDVALGFGREVNVRTRGAPVGQGWVGLLGVGLSWRRCSAQGRKC